MTRSLALLLFLSTAGCPTSKAIGPDEPPTIPVTPAPSATVRENSAPSADVPVEPPAPMIRFGAPCNPDDVIHCGTKARVAVTFETGNLRNPTLQIPCEQGDFIDSGSRPAAGCVSEDRVYLSGTCLECRQYSFWDMAGIVPEMTDQQLVFAQQRIGLPKQPLLRTADAWRTALASRASKTPKRKR